MQLCLLAIEIAVTVSWTHQCAGALPGTWPTLFLSFPLPSHKVSNSTASVQTGKWRLSEVMELSRVTQSDGQAKIQTQGGSRPSSTPASLEAAVPASACGLPQVLPDAFCSLNQPVWASQHVRSITSPISLGTRAGLVPSAPEGTPCQMPSFSVPASLLCCQGQWEWHQPDGVAWWLFTGARGRSHEMWLVCAGAGKLQRVAQVPLVSCLEDLSQGHVLHTHSTVPCHGKEFKGKGGK